MLIAMAITLLMMAGVVNLFANMSAGVRDRRAMIELGGQLRAAREQLNRDLAGATCPAITWQKPGENVGYIEIIEGVRSDANPLDLTLDQDLDVANDTTDGFVDLDPATLVPSSQINSTDGMGLGDYDDVLALTVRSNSEPFEGQIPGGGKVESDLAEVIWFAVREIDTPDAGNEGAMRRVYRRALVIAPWVNPIDPTTLAVPFSQVDSPIEFFQRFDISAHWDPVTARWVPNTLSDLTKRENRYFHTYAANAFPHVFVGNPVPLKNDRLGQDLLLNDALAFDVRVYDPGAPLRRYLDGVFQPGDPGWTLSINPPPNPPESPESFGAFVDLGWAIKPVAAGATYMPSTVSPLPQFYDARKLVPQGTTGTGIAKSVQSAWIAGITNDTAFPATYDTWSEHYEKDGIDQDNDGLVDEGTNGFDDLEIDPNNPTGPRIIANGVDDVAERETSPPYDVPLRGIQVKLRVYEREARQVREATVVRSFVP